MLPACHGQVVVVVNVYLFGRMPHFTLELPIAFAFYDLSLLEKAKRETVQVHFIL